MEKAFKRAGLKFRGDPYFLSVLLLFTVFCSPFEASAFESLLKNNTTPTAYIYADAGACDDGCIDAAAQLALRNGLKVVRVKNANLFTENDRIQPRLGDLWIQPGGDAIRAAKDLGQNGLERIRRWVAGGLNYLGFCAGSFLADQFVDDASTVPGLGLIPFPTEDFLPGHPESRILEQLWHGRLRWLYFQEGATFSVPRDSAVSVVATYADRRPSVIHTRYGYGQVVLSGVHPEAPISWSEIEGLVDPDGEDMDLADELVDRALSPL